MPDVAKVVLLIETSGEYARGLLRGIANYSRLHGPWAFYSEPPFERGRSLTLKGKTLPPLENWGANGIIMHDEEKTERVLAMGLPTIVIHNTKHQIANLPKIVPDPEQFGKMAAEHFISKGFSNFAYCGYSDRHWSIQRGKSFADSLKRAGFDLHYYQRPRNEMKRSWQPKQANWLRSLPKPVGIMACNDNCGRVLVEGCRIEGLVIPDEVAILGVDNDEFVCNLSAPPLSSIAVNTERAGYEAAELLDKMMKGQKVTNHKIIVRPLYVVPRQSTDILMVEDEHLAKALRYIREHIRDLVSVSDVVNVTEISRRSLEMRFKKIVGRSIYAEIRRLRVELISKMLLETNLPVSKIAIDLNYPSIEHIARYFKSETTLSPTEYRKFFAQK